MGKINRGETTKLSIRLSAEAARKIEKISTNLNLSKGGVIMFALAKILGDFPSKSAVLNLENEISLEPGNFPVTIKKDIAEIVHRFHDAYDIKKNVLIGLVVSDYFQKLSDPDLVEDREDARDEIRPFPKIEVSINEVLKKKIDEFCDQYYIPISGVISFSLIKGAYESFPIYKSSKKVSFFTRVPWYLVDKIKAEANRLEIPESFYVELCLYQSFIEKENVFLM